MLSHARFTVLGMAMSVGRPVHHFDSDWISSQLLDALSWKFGQIFIVPRRWILTTLVVPWEFLLCHYEVEICGFVIVDELPWNCIKDIHLSIEMNWNPFADDLTLHLVKCYDRIPAKPMTLPSALALFCVLSSKLYANVRLHLAPLCLSTTSKRC